MLPPPFAHTRFFPTRPEVKNAYSSILLWGEHLQEGEEVRAVIMLKASTVLLTDRRVMELTPHMDDFGFWNVRQFEGYERTLDVPTHATTVAVGQASERGYQLLLQGPSGSHTLLLEPFRILTSEHIDEFVGLLTRSVGGAPGVT